MSAAGDVQARWQSSEFRDELVDWVERAAGPVLDIEQAKLRPWAAVWRVRTPDRALYAKQNSPGQLFEAGLAAELARLAPAYVVAPVAVDRERGLLLTPDQGPVFAETVRGDDLDAWCRLVQRAMELSRLVSGRVGDLRAAGLTPCRVPADHAGVIDSLAADVGDLGLPDSLVHNDLHDHNAFDLPGGLAFFDFADAVLAHPLSGLLIPLNVLAGRLGEPDATDPRLQRVADAALEVWSDLAPITALRRALPAALRLGCLGRAECWARVVPDLSGAALEEWGGAARAWLERLDEPPMVRFA